MMAQQLVIPAMSFGCCRGKAKLEPEMKDYDGIPDLVTFSVGV